MGRWRFPSTTWASPSSTWALGHHWSNSLEGRVASTRFHKLHPDPCRTDSVFYSEHATYHAARRLQPLIRGCHCTLSTKHNPSTTIRIHGTPTRKDTCWFRLDSTAMCSSSLDPSTPLTDCLFHTPVSTVTLGVDYDKLTSLQSTVLLLLAAGPAATWPE